jgi:large subunit ribosomal protein L6
MKGKDLELSLGYSHPIVFTPPEGIKIEVEKMNITVSGIDRQTVGQAAANIRQFRQPEPYKGKGVKYVDEYIKRKAGKMAASSGSGS